MLAHTQAKCVAGNAAIDVRKQIFVRRDAKRGRSILPFDYKGASDIDVSKSADCAFLGLNHAVASNSRPSASSRQNDAGREKKNRDLLHVKYASCHSDAATRCFGFKNSRKGVSPERHAAARSRRFLFTAQFSASPCQREHRRYKIPHDNRRPPIRLQVVSA